MPDSEQQTLAVFNDPRSIVAGRYVVDSIHTRVLFNLMHFGISNYWGEFYGPIGWLEIDPRSPEKAKLEVSVPTSQVTTNSRHLDEELRSAEWLDAPRFPYVTLSANGIRLVGEGKAKLTGQFTLHGVTKPVEFLVDFVAGGKSPFSGAPTIGFQASARISRREFGVAAKFPIVGDAVNIIVSAAFDFA